MQYTSLSTLVGLQCVGLHTLLYNCLEELKADTHCTFKKKKCSERAINSSKISRWQNLDRPLVGWVPLRVYILISWSYHHYIMKALTVSLQSWFLPLKCSHLCKGEGKCIPILNHGLRNQTDLGDIPSYGMTLSKLFNRPEVQLSHLEGEDNDV